MENRIQMDIMSAMKEKDETRLAALRAIKTSIMQTKTSPNFKGDRETALSDAEVLKVIQKLVKERKDSFDIYVTAGRNDLADKEHKEMLILKEYLPEPLTENELTKIVLDVIQDTGAQSKKDMKIVMAEVNNRVCGRADGKTISITIAKHLI